MKYLIATLGALAMGLVIWTVPALAGETAEKTSTFRLWWDAIWRILNFSVLVWLAYKYGKKPMMDFIKGQRNIVAEEIEAMELAKSNAIAQRKAIEAKTAGLADELADYDQALSELAAKERKKLMAEAELESKLIMERAEIWAGQALRAARAELASDILDLAGDIATDKLRAAITSEDRQRMFDQFTQEIVQG